MLATRTNCGKIIVKKKEMQISPIFQKKIAKPNETHKPCPFLTT